MVASISERRGVSRWNKHENNHVEAIEVRSQVVKKHILVIICLIIITPFLCIYTSGMSESIIVYVYTGIHHRGLVVTLDDNGVPINDYQYLGNVYVGKQRNAVTIAQRALVCWDKDVPFLFSFYPFEDRNKECDEQGFLNCAQWIVNNAVPSDTYVTWEYNFPYEHYNLTPPWRSAMAQGQCIQVLVRAYELTGESSYLELARKALGAFYVEVENRGVTLKGDEGWWYEEYAGEGGANPRVLNGHIYALVGIYEYYEETNDKDAKYLFDKGEAALKAHLCDYDTGAWTYYDTLGKMATQHYHELHIAQMLYLYNCTGDPVFKEYHDRWEHYRPIMFPLKLIREPTKMNLAIYFSNFLLYLAIVEVGMVLVGRVRRRKIENPRKTR